MDIGKIHFGPINPNKGPMESAASCVPFSAQAEIAMLRERIERLEKLVEKLWSGDGGKP